MTRLTEAPRPGAGCSGGFNPVRANGARLFAVAAWKAEFPQTGKKLVEFLVKDMGGGQAARALQDLNELAVLPENKGKPFAGYPPSASPTPVH